MERRTILAGGILCIAGCSSPLRGISASETPGVIEGLLLETVPAEATVTPLDEEPLVDVKVLQELATKATHPSNRTTRVRDGKEYEMVAVELQRPERPPEKMREARIAIDTLRDETGGAYVSHESFVLELGYVIPA